MPGGPKKYSDYPKITLKCQFPPLNSERKEEIYKMANKNDAEMAKNKTQVFNNNKQKT